MHDPISPVAQAFQKAFPDARIVILAKRPVNFMRVDGHKVTLNCIFESPDSLAMVESFAALLPEADLPMSGQFVADLCIDAVRRQGKATAFTIEALVLGD